MFRSIGFRFIGFQFYWVLVHWGSLVVVLVARNQVQNRVGVEVLEQQLLTDTVWWILCFSHLAVMEKLSKPRRRDDNGKQRESHSVSETHYFLWRLTAETVWLPPTKTKTTATRETKPYPETPALRPAVTCAQLPARPNNTFNPCPLGWRVGNQSGIHTYI